MPEELSSSREQAPYGPPLPPHLLGGPRGSQLGSSREQAPHGPPLPPHPFNPSGSRIGSGWEQAPNGPSLPPNPFIEPPTSLQPDSGGGAPHSPPLPPNSFKGPSPSSQPNSSREQAPYGPPLSPQAAHPPPPSSPSSPNSTYDPKIQSKPQVRIPPLVPSKRVSPEAGGPTKRQRRYSMDNSQRSDPETQTVDDEPPFGPPQPPHIHRDLHFDDRPPFGLPSFRRNTNNPRPPRRRDSGLRKTRPSSDRRRYSPESPVPPSVKRLGAETSTRVRNLTARRYVRPSDATPPADTQPGGIGREGVDNPVRDEYLHQQKAVWQRYFRQATGDSSPPSIDSFLAEQGQLFDAFHIDPERTSLRDTFLDEQRTVFNLFQAFRPTDPGPDLGELPDRPSSREEFLAQQEDLYRRYPGQRPRLLAPERPPSDSSGSSAEKRETPQGLIDPWAYREPQRKY